MHSCGSQSTLNCSAFTDALPCTTTTATRPQAGPTGARPNSTLSKAKRDARAIPNLVFALEAWERQLVLAGKAAKVTGGWGRAGGGY